MSPLDRGIAAGVIVTSFAVSVPTGQEPLAQAPGTEFVGAVNLPGKNLKLDGTIFLPSTVRRADAVIVIVNWGDTQQQLFDRSPWRNLAQNVAAALLHVRITQMVFGQGPRAEGTFGDARLGAGEGLLMLLNQLGDEASHPELARIPLVVFGFSAAGNFGSSFAAWKPDRVVGFIRYHSARVPPVTAIQGIPALLIVGEKDNPAPLEDTPILWKAGRSAGAPWAIVIEPEAAHLMRAEFIGKANNLMVPWITAVIRLRVKGAGLPLQPIDQRVGWLGNTDTLEVAAFDAFPGSSSGANWFPDVASASGWRTMVSRGK